MLIVKNILLQKELKKKKSRINIYSNKNLSINIKGISYITSPRKYGYNRLKSSDVNSGRTQNLGKFYLSKISNHKHNHNIVDKRKIKKASSLNNYSLHCKNKINKNIKYEKINMKSNIKRQFSYNKSKNDIMNKNSHNKNSC